MCLCMVNAGLPLIPESTLAARPVGARSTDFTPKSLKAAVTAAMALVLPVPA